MTDTEIIKALECCQQEDKCGDCPYGAACLDDKYVSIISKDALDLINRQKAEIERLKKCQEEACQMLHATREELKMALATKVVNEIHIDKQFYEECKYEMKQARLQAIKEFAERLEDRVYSQAVRIKIDNLVEEMTENDFKE